LKGRERRPTFRGCRSCTGWGSRHRITRYAALVCLAGAALQVTCGAVAAPASYPAIVEPRYELLWALATAGMAAGVVGWLALDLSRPRWIALVGGGLAILGYLIRFAISVVLILRPSAAVEAPIVGSILLIFLGLGMVGIGTLLARRLTGWRAWEPLLALAAGLVTAPVYSIDKHVHFVLLGLLWAPPGCSSATWSSRALQECAPPIRQRDGDGWSARRHGWLAERERVGLGAGLEEGDLQYPFTNRVVLAHELVHAAVPEQAVPVFVDVYAVRRAWSLAVE
jgi:hypothetical protein